MKEIMRAKIVKRLEELYENQNPNTDPFLNNVLDEIIQDTYPDLSNEEYWDLWNNTVSQKNLMI